MKEKTLDKISDCILIVFIFCLCIGLFYFISENEQLKEELEYTKESFAELYQEVKALEHLTESLSTSVKEAETRAENIVYNVLGGW